MSNPGMDNNEKKFFRFILGNLGMQATTDLFCGKEIIEEAWNGIDADKLNFYLNFHTKIPGWANIRAIKIILALDKLLSENSVEGDISEIGVYSGRSSLLFMILNENTNAKFYFCDNFPKGRLDQFKFYIKHLCKKDLDINILVKNSDKLTEEEFSNNNKMIHIDGSHDYVPVYQDMRFCSNKLAKKGVLIIDDYMNPNYPGVNMATNNFIKEHSSLSPFLYAFGKLFCCRSQDKDWFDDQMEILLSSEFLYDLNFRNAKLPLLGSRLNCLML